jgi:hypothetical protein
MLARTARARFAQVWRWRRFWAGSFIFGNSLFNNWNFRSSVILGDGLIDRLRRFRSTFFLNGFRLRRLQLDLPVDRVKFRQSRLDLIADRFGLRQSRLNLIADRFGLREFRLDLIADRFGLR